jgi:hypothetical protein
LETRRAEEKSNDCTEEEQVFVQVERGAEHQDGRQVTMQALHGGRHRGAHAR